MLKLLKFKLAKFQEKHGVENYAGMPPEPPSPRRSQGAAPSPAATAPALAPALAPPAAATPRQRQQEQPVPAHEAAPAGRYSLHSFRLVWVH